MIRPENSASAGSTCPTVPAHHLEKNLQDTRDQLAATSEVLTALGESMETADVVLETVVRSVQRLCKSDVALVYLLEGSHYRLARSVGLTADYVRYIDSHPLVADRATLTGRVGLDGQTQQIADVLSDPDYGRQDTQRIAGFRTVVGAPMTVGRATVGVLCVWRTTVSPYDDRELAVLTTFATQAAIAIRSVDLMRTLESRTAELGRKVDQLEAIGAVTDAVNSSLDLDEVLARIVRHAVQLSETDGGSIMEFDEATQQFSVRATYGTSPEVLDQLRQMSLELADSFVGRVASEARPLQEPDLRVVRRDTHQQALFAAGWLSMLAAPLLRADRIIGVLVVRRLSPGGFSEEMSDMLLAFAEQSALAIVNARLFRELEVKSAQLEVASRHKSEFLASMSHELRTPLNAIIGFSEVLLERMYGELNDKQDEYLQDILGSGQHLLVLLNDVLDLSKVEAGRMELEKTTFTVNQVIDESIFMVRERAARRGIQLECETVRTVPDVHADRVRIRQVLVNLLTNAVKFTPPGGRVKVGVQTGPGVVEIAVSDTGPGVPVEDREHIFESFQQGSRAHSHEEGTGLGLTLSRRIVHLHAGRMWLDSDVGAGSTFGFSIPISAPTTLDAESTTPTAAAGSEAGPRVVVIEEDPVARELVTVYLRSADIAVTSAESGTDGVALVHATRPDAIVLDLRLPDVDGWELLTEFRNDPMTKAIPVILVSVMDQRNQGLALGAAEYLVKPVRRELLLRALVDVGVLPNPATTEAGQ